MLDAEIASALNKIIQNSQFKKKVSLEELNAQKREPVSARETNRLHDLRLISSDWRSGYSIGLCWSILCHSPWWQHSGVRYEMGRSSIIDVKSSIRLHLGKSVQIKDTWVCATQNCIGIVRHGESSEEIGSQLSKSWKPWWKDVKIRNSVYETLTLGTGELNQEQ